MRVLIDTNLFIAYLLKPDENSFIPLILDAVVEGSITLLVPESLLAEIDTTIQQKPYLNQKISRSERKSFLHLLQSISEEIALITETIPRITRDEKDDYLIAYAVVGRADYLISGDKDLLVLEQVQQVAVVTSAQFRQVLRQYGDSES